MCRYVYLQVVHSPPSVASSYSFIFVLTIFKVMRGCLLRESVVWLGRLIDSGPYLVADTH